MIHSGEPLRCPVCDGEWNHHVAVLRYCRVREDGQTYLLIPGDNAIRLSDENPSHRRGAVRIVFECEGGHTWALDIVQHKGQEIVQLVVLEHGKSRGEAG